MVIRGDKEDNAVLCTSQQTYEVKQGEVSNAMLLLPELKLGPDLQATGDTKVDYREVLSTCLYTYSSKQVWQN